MADEKVTPTQPQTDKAIAVSDPSTIDDTATYSYNPQINFSISSYTTYTQNTINTSTPPRFSGDVQFIPTTSPFILELDGSGFDINKKTDNSLKIYAMLDGYIAVIPPLSSITNIIAGNAFGYVVKSSTKLWIYFSALTFQNIWFKPTGKTFNGKEPVDKIQLESGTSKYPLINGVTPLDLFITSNNGKIINKPNFFADNNFTSVSTAIGSSITISQSPFIIALQGNRKGNTITPALLKKGGEITRTVYLYGHSLLKDSDGNDRKVMLVKTSSKLLSSNPSALPQLILDAVQDDDTIKNTKVDILLTLDYFKTGHFLNDLQQSSKKQLKAYSYFAADGTVKKCGANQGLPQDTLSNVSFTINTMPAGTYYVVIYSQTTGVYFYAPEVITINLAAAGLQIHDVTPDPILLEAPTFTINGFNFPTKTDINNGAIFTVSLVDQTQVSTATQNIKPLFDQTAFLQINKASPTTSTNNNGTINLVSDSQFTANFTNLHQSTSGIGSCKLFASVTYQAQDVSAGKINEASLSNTITIQAQPVINFLTNAVVAPAHNVYQKSLVRIDQATKGVIAFGSTSSNLYIVGKNFGNAITTGITLNGNKQKITDIINWPFDPSLSAIVVSPSIDNIKGDATVIATVNNISSEAFVYKLATIKIKDTKTDAYGVSSKSAQTITDNNLFQDIIPYNQFDQHTLLNSKNTKISSSIALKLINVQTKQSVSLTADLNTSVALPFLPNQIVIPEKTKLNKDGSLNITFNIYNMFNVNISTPKIFRLQHENGNYLDPVFNPNDIMTVIGTGFVDGMRYNINGDGWTDVDKLTPLIISNTSFQSFPLFVPTSNGNNTASIKVSNDQAATVSSSNAAAKQNGAYKVNTIVVNDNYSPLLKINQRLPAGIKMYAKGTQNTMTDLIDANMSIYSQITPFLGGFKTLLIVIRIIVCIIDVICALINPFKLIVAIIALMDCIIDLLSLFPQLAVPIMILSFLQNFVGFIETFIQQIEAYVFSIINSQLALVKAQISKDFALLAAAEQQAFSATKQIRDVIAFLEPALQIIQIFKDLLNFAMHFPCATNQGGKQADGSCPPDNMQKLIDEMVADKKIAPNTYFSLAGNMVRANGTVRVKITKVHKLSIGSMFDLSPGEKDFIAGTKTVETIIDNHNFTYLESGTNIASTVDATIDTVVTSDQQATLATMFCQAVGLQTATLQTMPGFNGLDGFGNPISPPLSPGSTSIVPNVSPILPNVAAAIECMNNLTDQIDNALNNGQTFILTPEQGEQLLAAYTQCAQNLLDQTNQALGDVCVLAVSALNSELKVSPKGRVAPDFDDDFIRAKIALPSTQPSSAQDNGLTIDLATITDGVNIPSTITGNQSGNDTNATANFGLKPDIYTPIIIQTNNKSGQRQSKDTIYFNAENSDVGTLISIGDIIEIVGGKFNGLQFPILGIQQIFTTVRLTCKLDITFEQRLLIGEQPLPENLSGFDVKVIAHLAGNDAVAVVPADDVSIATIQILARDHHGHEIGPKLANKVAINIESGKAEFVPIIPSSTTDITGVIQEQGTHYIANLKSNCSGTVIVSASVCGVIFEDIGYFANDINHAITTRKKTIKIIYTPPIPKPVPNAFVSFDKPQQPGTDFNN